jgi:hypothetical protein
MPYTANTPLTKDTHMTLSVELTPITFARLQAHAVPLVDTIESVINRLLDAYEARAGAPASASGDGNGGNDEVRRFNPVAPPDLTHTRVMAIDLNGEPLARNEANWNGLLYAAVRLAKTRTKSAADLKKAVIANFVAGEKTDEGYRFLADIGLSVQGQDANGAWKAACHIAQHIGCPLKVMFVWRHKEGAAFPGVTGQFSVAVGR